MSVPAIQGVVLGAALGAAPPAVTYLGIVYIGIGFLGAFVADTIWWRQRTRWPRLSVVLRTVLFLILVRGVMHVAPNPAWTAGGIGCLLALGSLLLWGDHRYHHRLAAAGRYGKPQGGGDAIGNRGSGADSLEEG